MNYRLVDKSIGTHTVFDLVGGGRFFVTIENSLWDARPRVRTKRQIDF